MGSMEATVESIEFVSPCWFRIRVRELNKPLMLHTNWFLSRDALVRRGHEIDQIAIKPGDRVSFEVAKYPLYMTDHENLYVRDFQVLGQNVEEVEADVSIL